MYIQDLRDETLSGRYDLLMLLLLRWEKEWSEAQSGFITLISHNLQTKEGDMSFRVHFR